MTIKKIAGLLRNYWKYVNRIISLLTFRDITQALALSIFVGVATLAIISFSFSMPLGIAVGGVVTILGTMLGFVALAQWRLQDSSLREVATALLHIAQHTSKNVTMNEMYIQYDLNDDSTEVRYELENKDTTPLSSWLFFLGSEGNIQIQTEEATILEAGEAVSNRMVRVIILPKGVGPRSFYYQALALFMPPITQNETVLLKVRFLRPFLWKQLRDAGRDSGRYTLQRSCNKVTIDLVFPRGWDGTIAPAKPQEGRVLSQINRDGRLEVKWIINSLDAYTTLDYEVLVKNRDIRALRP